MDFSTGLRFRIDPPAGIPFLVSAVLIDKLKSTFNWIKRNYLIINRVSGGFLVFIGIAMATGYLGKFLALLS